MGNKEALAMLRKLDRDFNNSDGVTDEECEAFSLCVKILEKQRDNKLANKGPIKSIDWHQKVRTY